VWLESSGWSGKGQFQWGSQNQVHVTLYQGQLLNVFHVWWENTREFCMGCCIIKFLPKRPTQATRIVWREKGRSKGTSWKDIALSQVRDDSDMEVLSWIWDSKVLWTGLDVGYGEGELVSKMCNITKCLFDIQIWRQVLSVEWDWQSLSWLKSPRKGEHGQKWSKDWDAGHPNLESPKWEESKKGD
jgi:hypothetical protein